MVKQGRIYITAEGDYAVANDSRNWWIIIPVVDGVVQHGSLDEEFIMGTYRTAVDYISVVRSLSK